MCKLLCVATQGSPFLDEWKRSAKYHNWEPIILGMGSPWKGFQTKISLLAQTLATYEPHTLCLVTDAYDLLINAPPSLFKFKMSKIQSNIVVGAETRKGPNSPSVQTHPGWFPNMGFVAGTARDLADLYKNILTHTPHDDQIGVGVEIKRKPPNFFHMDVKSEFVLNLNYQWQAQRMKGNPIVYAKTQPIAVHVPFLHLDLGWRMNRTLGLLKRPQIHPCTSLQGLLAHLSREAKNPAFKWIKRAVLLNLVCLPWGGRRFAAGLLPYPWAAVACLLLAAETNDRNVAALILTPCAIVAFLGAMCL